ncbi:aminotransferase class III-fold pyridoxal phosphate-dependent enzyme [Nonomuraea sp. NPDC004354]
MTDITTPEMLQILQRGRELHLDHYASGRLPFAAVGGSGSRQRMTELGGPGAGRTWEVLDASGGYASACLGMGHAAMVRALARGALLEQATDEIGSLERARLLIELFGDDGLLSDHFPPGDYHVSGRNSGSEGMELAMRLVWESRIDRHTMRLSADRGERDLVLAFEGAWHGWTGGLVQLLNRRHFRVGLPGADTARPYGIAVDHLPFGDADALEAYVAENGHRLLAVVVEPVQGDAGILLPPRGYLRRLADLVRDSGALLVADEVLTFGKTGAFLAMTDEHGPIPTDVTVIGKSLGMGTVPASMVIARRSLTVRGSGAVATSDLRPIACAVIRAGLEVIVGNDLLNHSAILGKQLGILLRKELVEAFPAVYREARGVGVLHGVELTEPASARMAGLREHVIRAGVYVEFMAGAGRRTGGQRYLFPAMRIAPPLITSPAEIDEMVDRIVAGSRTFVRASE